MPAKNGVELEVIETTGARRLKARRRQGVSIALVAALLGAGGTAFAAYIKTGGAQAITAATLTVRGDQLHEELAGLRGEVKELRDRVAAVKEGQVELSANLRNLIERTGQLWVTAPMPPPTPPRPIPARATVHVEHRDGGP